MLRQREWAPNSGAPSGTHSARVAANEERIATTKQGVTAPASGLVPRSNSPDLCGLPPRRPRDGVMISDRACCARSAHEIDRHRNELATRHLADSAMLSASNGGVRSACTRVADVWREVVSRVRAELSPGGAWAATAHVQGRSRQPPPMCCCSSRSSERRSFPQWRPLEGPRGRRAAAALEPRAGRRTEGLVLC